MAQAVVLLPHSASIRVHWSVMNQAQEIQKLIMGLNNDLFPHQKLNKDSRFQWFHFSALFFPFMLLSSLTQLETEDNGRSSVCALCHFSHVWLFETPWTVACQAPLSMGFSWHEYWSGSPNPPPRDLPDPGIKSTSFMSPAVAGSFFTSVPPGNPGGSPIWCLLFDFPEPSPVAMFCPLSLRSQQEETLPCSALF